MPPPSRIQTLPRNSLYHLSSYIAQVSINSILLATSPKLMTHIAASLVVDTNMQIDYPNAESEIAGGHQPFSMHFSDMTDQVPAWMAIMAAQKHHLLSS